MKEALHVLGQLPHNAIRTSSVPCCALDQATLATYPATTCREKQAVAANRYSAQPHIHQGLLGKPEWVAGLPPPPNPLPLAGRGGIRAKPSPFATLVALALSRQGEGGRRPGGASRRPPTSRGPPSTALRGWTLARVRALARPARVRPRPEWRDPRSGSSP